MKNVILVTGTQIDIGLRVIASILKSSYSIKFLNISKVELHQNELIYHEVLHFLKDADFVLFSSVDYRFDKISGLANTLRNTFKIPVIIGGVHAMLYPEECIEHFDAVCLGEADLVIKTLLDNWDKRFEIPINNFWYRKHDEIIKTKRIPLTKNLDNVPTPEYNSEVYYYAIGEKIINIANEEFTEYSHHQIGHKKTLVYNSDRGCPNSCSYCYNKNLKLIFGAKDYYRKKSINSIISELRSITHNGRKYEFINLMNDNMASRTESELELFADLYSHYIKLPFYCMVSPMELTESKLKNLIKAGCAELNIGVQTNEKTNLEIYNRYQSNSTIYKVSKMVSKYKNSISVFYDFIINNPAESSGSIVSTIELINNLSFPCDIVSHHLCLGKNTALYNKFKASGIIPNDDQKVYISDFHDFNKFISSYIGKSTFVENILIEWLSGTHTNHLQGRLPRYFDDFKSCTYLYTWINTNNRLLNLVNNSTNKFTIDFFIQNLSFFRKRKDLIVSLNTLLPKVEYSNFVKIKKDNTYVTV